MKLLIFLCFAVFVCFSAFPQTDPLTQAHGARSQGMGNLKVNLPDTWAIFNNIGTLDRVSSSQIGVAAVQRYGIQELSTLDLAFALKSNIGSFGIGVSRYGGKLFNQQLIGMGYSQKLGIASFGVKLDWFQTHIQDFGHANSFIFSLGGVADLGPNLQIGAYFSNLNRSKISSEYNDRHPTTFSIGVTYLPISNLQLHLEIEKDILYKPNVKAGIEYGIQDWLYLRCGVNSKPSNLNFGLGLKPGKFQFDYALGQNNALGNTHHVSFGYLW
ncbi:hypothetical protein JYB62_07280 [Algoriphagus lutimaris]|uniref:hypothetical protein n=1 Tax=Algoriphagus lutimaris TaxID=613197 RepID=UPI00196B1F94|nr:hypothetical protein [Algoriphagus lutimaris]MBN3519802.1 hypothetical protein [Algoriphagus lutimaris]